MHRPSLAAAGRAPRGCSPLSIPVPRWCGAGEVDLEGDTVLRNCCLTVRFWGGFMSPSLVLWLGGAQGRS